MEVARSNMAIPSQTRAAQVAPPGARDAADGFSQISTRDLKPGTATTPGAGAAQTTVADPALPTPVATEMKPPAPRDANGSTTTGSPALNSEKAPHSAGLEVRGAGGEPAGPGLLVLSLSLSFLL